MPSFYVDDMDIEPDEFVRECSSREKRELVEILAEEGYTHSKLSTLEREFSGRGSSLEFEHMDKCDLLANKFYSMSNEDLELLETLYNKYR